MERRISREFLPFYDSLKNKKDCDNDNFNLLSQSLYSYYNHIWNSCSHNLDKQIYFTFSKKNKNENKLETDAFLKNLVSICEKLDKDSENTELLLVFRNTVYTYIENSLFFKNKISTKYPKEFITTTSDFIKRLKKFDKSLSFYDTFQALRNVWTMNILQSISNAEVKLTPAIFAYSTLYPYTDNILDSNEITNQEKHFVSQRLKHRLTGTPLLPLNIYEEKVYKLVTIIEDFFPRKNYYGLYKSLIYIHHFQTKSMKQQTMNVLCEDNETLSLSFKKGGMSVLADAYLIKGDLDMEEIIFSFGLGILLQLLDDLQDITIDMKNGHETIFTAAAKSQDLEQVTLKALNFTGEVLSLVAYSNSELKDEIKKALFENCILMMLFSISRNKALYSDNFMKAMEQYYPFPAAYMKKFNKKLQKIYYKLRKLKKLRAEDILDMLNAV